MKNVNKFARCFSFQMSLWANKSDLSLSLGSSDESVRVNPHESVTKLKPFILADQSKDVWEYLQGLRNKTEKVEVTSLQLTVLFLFF